MMQRIDVHLKYGRMGSVWREDCGLMGIDWFMDPLPTTGYCSLLIECEGDGGVFTQVAVRLADMLEREMLPGLTAGESGDVDAVAFDCDFGMGIILGRGEREGGARFFEMEERRLDL